MVSLYHRSAGSTKWMAGVSGFPGEVPGREERRKTPFIMISERGQEMLNKKHLFTVVLLALLFICCGFSGCRGPQYSEEDENGLSEAGREMMQSWLDENLSGAKVETAFAQIDMIPSGPHYLTNYVSGTFEDGGNRGNYLINTADGEVFLLYDEEPFLKSCLPYVFRALDFTGREEECSVENFSAMLWFPEETGTNPDEPVGTDGVWLPGDLVLTLRESGEEAGAVLEAFVSSPEERTQLVIGGQILVPEDVSLEAYDMKYFLDEREKAGLRFGNFLCKDRFEERSVFGKQTTYTRYGFAEMDEPDCRIFMREKTVEEEENDGEITVTENRESRFLDLTFRKTDEGWLIVFPDREHRFDFSIYADGDSDFLQQEYHSHEDREAYLGPGEVIGGNRYFERDLFWKEADDGSFVLTTEDGRIKSFFGGEELIPRDTDTY